MQHLIGHTRKDLLNVILTLLMVVCVFDPGDKIFHLKMPLFILSWLIFISIVMIKKTETLFCLRSSIYVYCMLLIPFISITYYFIINGSEPYDGFQYIKSYLFISLVFILSAKKIDLIPRVSWMLTFLSVIIIAISLIFVIYPDIGYVIYLLGLEYGILAIGNRNYGDIDYNSFFYTTSLMITIPIAYFVHKTLTCNRKKRILYVTISLINIYGMFLGGTRNNIMIAIFLPLLIIFWYSRKKKIIIIIISIFMSVLVFLYYDVIMEMFSRSEGSNAIKIGLLIDYYNIFFNSNLRILLFGQGLGSYTYWSAGGYYGSQTELTFLELFRNYGLIGGLILLSFILFPLKYLLNKYRKNIHYLLLGYLSYLFAALFNPIFFSSSGMIMLSIIVAKIFSLKSKIIGEL